MVRYAILQYRRVELPGVCEQEADQTKSKSKRNQCCQDPGISVLEPRIKTEMLTPKRPRFKLKNAANMMFHTSFHCANAFIRPSLGS